MVGLSRVFSVLPSSEEAMRLTILDKLEASFVKARQPIYNSSKVALSLGVRWLVFLGQGYPRRRASYVMCVLSLQVFFLFAT